MVARDTVALRKAMPIASGVLDYFPDALLVVAEVSRIGNEQHHPGEPLHWDKSKSTDEADALLRHLIDRGTLDTDGVRHTAKVAWRALALLQRELDAEAALPTGEALKAAEAPALLSAEEAMRAAGQDLQSRWQAYIERSNRANEPLSLHDEGSDVDLFAIPDHAGTYPPAFLIVAVTAGDPTTQACCGVSVPDHTLQCPLYR